MASIKIEQLNAGMILASDVKDRSGRILIRSGMEITDKHIKVLKTWGVRFIDINTEEHIVETTLVINVDPEKLAAAAKLIDMLFQHTDREHPAIKELSALGTQRLAQQGLGRNSHGA